MVYILCGSAFPLMKLANGGKSRGRPAQVLRLLDNQGGDALDGDRIGKISGMVR